MEDSSYMSHTGAKLYSTKTKPTIWVKDKIAYAKMSKHFPPRYYNIIIDKKFLDNYKGVGK